MQSVLDFARETITGKCYVVCTSKDERNPQPSKEASDKSDYIFYRTLDAGNFTISDKILDKIINIEVKYLLNWEADLKPNPSPGLKTIVVEGRLETNEADVLVNSSKVESLKLLEDKVKGNKFEQITNRVTKIEDGDTLSLYPKYESGGSIHKLLHEYDPFREPVIRNYTTQILARLAYLHGRNTMHRDIKGANIPVDPSGEIKLADFGMAKHIVMDELSGFELREEWNGEGDDELAGIVVSTLKWWCLGRGVEWSTEDY